MAAELVATGKDAAAVARAREGIRELFGFLFSTPAYWPSLELYGWKDLGERLRTMTREGRWAEMTPQISDEMLDVLAPTAPYAEIADLLRERQAGLGTRITFPLPEDPADEPAARAAIEALRS
jgi:hypothetical protein